MKLLILLSVRKRGDRVRGIGERETHHCQTVVHDFKLFGMLSFITINPRRGSQKSCKNGMNLAISELFLVVYNTSKMPKVFFNKTIFYSFFGLIM